MLFKALDDPENFRDILTSFGLTEEAFANSDSYSKITPIKMIQKESKF